MKEQKSNRDKDMQKSGGRKQTLLSKGRFDERKVSSLQPGCVFVRVSVLGVIRGCKSGWKGVGIPANKSPLVPERMGAIGNGCRLPGCLGRRMDSNVW